MTQQYKKKLIEVALPLVAINKAAAREKSIRHGHPSTLHLWWARRPLAACRAVLFASLVDDPSSDPVKYPTEEKQEKERQRLFKIIEELVQWENSNNPKVLEVARKEIMKSTGGNPPPVYDPFCGGGSIPLEAQRLGLEAHGSDLNPVAVLITKSLIEIPPKFSGKPPINPEACAKFGADSGWNGVAGLAEDVRYYGQWVRHEAEKRIGYLYPKVKLPREHGGGEATVIAWLWARTVSCPNPACRAIMPLIRSYTLATKKGLEAWVEPQVDQVKKKVIFHIRRGPIPRSEHKKIYAGTSFINESGKKVKATFLCPFCKTGIAKGEYIDNEAKFGNLGVIPLAIIAEGSNGRYYANFDESQALTGLNETSQYLRENGLLSLIPTEPARGTFASNAQGRVYGFKNFGDYYTSRQLVTMITFSQLVCEVLAKVKRDAINYGMKGDLPNEYAEAIATYIAFLVDQMANHQSSLCSWNSANSQMRNVFARQGIAMTWDFAESNPFCQSSGSFYNLYERLLKGLVSLPATRKGYAENRDATEASIGNSYMISTDPPYYDNIEYADLSDYFYIWLRRSMSSIYPDLFNTILVPKSKELVASSHRFEGDLDRAKRYFEEGLRKAFTNIINSSNHDFPTTVYYAFKQAEGDEEAEDEAITDSRSSSGWESMLTSLINSGYVITGTWPIRTEKTGRSVEIGTNALASSIVLVCRKRKKEAPIATRREFVTSLRQELPHALHELQQGNVAPVDLAQSAIGPGMAIFSGYNKVLEADGEQMNVRNALQLINQELDAFLSAQEGEMDADTQFCVAWFEQFRMNEAPFGQAEVMTKAKNTSIDRMQHSGALTAAKGKVALLTRDEIQPAWDPDGHGVQATVWLSTQHLVKRLLEHGEDAAALLAYKLGLDKAEKAKALAYRLYNVCERKGWADEALAYNALVVAWPSIQEKMTTISEQPTIQSELNL